MSVFHDVVLTEADALDALLHSVSDVTVLEALTVLAHAPVVVCTGMGKSGHVARKVAATMASLGTRAMFVHPAEASHGDLGMIGRSDALLAFSWSGDTVELKSVLSLGLPTVGVTSRPDSALGRASRVLIELPRWSEADPNGQAPTVSTIMQMAVGDALAVALSQLRGFTADDFRKLHPGGSLGVG